MLQVGDGFPPFDLAAQTGERFTQQDLLGQRYVMFFYPKDNTPACTQEACEFRDLRAAFVALSVQVFGVSADLMAAHQRFAKKFDLSYPLLSDPDHLLLEPLGVWAQKKLYGREYLGIVRSTFVVGSDGRIEYVWPKVRAKGHAEEVLAYLRGG